MSIVSATYATLLSLFFGVVVLVEKFGSWEHLSHGDKVWACAATCYAVLLVFSGWLHVQFKQVMIAVCHVALMFGVAGLGLFSGLSVLMDRSVMGGRGPDANPVAGIVYGYGMVEMVIGACCAACGIGVIISACRKVDFAESEA